jgi:hypothetical protein
MAVTRAMRGVGICSSMVRPLLDDDGIIGSRDLLIAVVGT